MLKNLKTVHKLALLILISVVGLVSVGYTGYINLLNTSREMESMYQDRLIPIKQINENRTFARTIDYLVLNIILTDNPGSKKDYTDQIAATSKAFSENLKKYEEQSLSPFETEKINYIRQQLTDARPSRQGVFEFIARNQNQEAYNLFAEKNRPATENITQALGELAEFNAKIAEDIHAKSIKDFERARFVFISLILGVAIILAFSGWAIARAIVAPLAVTVSKVEAMGNGDLTGSLPAELLSAQDETGQLGRAFNKANANIKNLIEEISETSHQLSAASEELTAGAEQSTNAADSIAAATGNVAKGAERQLNIVEKTVHAAEKISAEAEQISANANIVASTSDKTAESAARGQKTVETAIDQMVSIQSTVENLAREITALGLRSNEIGQIVEAISGIAGQTNLLALNAAIEAARAGEQGRGFAVVAEEVRKLAEQSQEAAKRISDLIGAIQSETNNAVQAMEAGTREVKTGAKLVDNAGVVFKEIASLINQTSNQAREISESIRQMAEDSQTIVGGVQELSATSKEVAGQTQHVSAATQEQTASLQEIASASNSLAKRAEDLQSMVRKFVI